MGHMIPEREAYTIKYTQMRHMITVNEGALDKVYIDGTHDSSK